MISKEEKAVIVGLWRQGNKIETIMWLTGIPYITIEKYINSYLKNFTNQ